MTGACKIAGVTPEQVDYVNAHGTATPHNDSTEAAAINRWAGARAATLPVSSTKACIGHLLGAAGAVEAVVSLMVLREQWLPPETSLVTPRSRLWFSDCASADRCARRHGHVHPFGLGGANATLGSCGGGGEPDFCPWPGAVSPAGWGVSALRETLQKGGAATGHRPVRPGCAKPLRVRPVPPPTQRPALLAHPRLRRASVITQHAVGAALEAGGRGCG